jgi:hypothetical protein
MDENPYQRRKEMFVPLRAEALRYRMFFMALCMLGMLYFLCTVGCLIYYGPLNAWNDFWAFYRSHA